MKQIIQTEQAPQAIGTYSQAIKYGNTVYLSGQIALDPQSMTLVSENIAEQIQQVFSNLQAVCVAAGGNLNDIVKLNVYLLDLKHFDLVNQAMEKFFQQPYPARVAMAVSALPKGAQFEVDAVMVVAES